MSSLPQSTAVTERGYSSSRSPRTIGLQLGEVFFRPTAKRLQRINQRSA